MTTPGYIVFLDIEMRHLDRAYHIQDPGNLVCVCETSLEPLGMMF